MSGVSLSGAPGEADRLARVALSRLAEPGNVAMLTQVDRLGAVATLRNLQAEAAENPDVSDLAPRIAALDPVRELEQAERVGLRFVTPSDPEWPSGLSDLALCASHNRHGGVPVGLWARGPLSLADLGQAVAVVGCRAATSYGESVAREFGAATVRTGGALVSGGAYGIDQAAHRGAIAAEGPTVAVLACGADRVYPAGHHDLLTWIARSGVVVSEAAPGCAPLKSRFLSRNRLIAGLSRATVVVEAAYRSGSLSTATWAERMARPVLGVPGPVTSASSQGVHQWIREGRATLAADFTHVREVLASAGQELVAWQREDDRLSDQLPPTQRRVLESLPVTRPAGVESIAGVAGLSRQETERCLAVLTNLGLAVQQPAGWLISRDARAG